MDFSLSEEQQMYLGLFNDFAANEVARVAEVTDREEAPPLELLKKAAAQGFLGVPIPEQYGGAGLDFLSYTLLLEAVARHCLSTAVTIAIHTSLASMALLLAGSETLKERYLTRLASGEVLGSFMLTEPEAGTDARALQTAACRENGHYRVNGIKTWVSNGELAGLHIVVAATPAAGRKDCAMFALEKAAPGLSVGYREPTLGLRGLTLNTVYLEDCWVPAENRFGEEGSGWEVVDRLVDLFRESLAAVSLGAAEGALELGLRFAVERKQFGIAIAEKDAIQAYFGDTKVDIESLRHLVHHAAWLCDAGREFSQEASIAKYKGALVAKEAANKMLQIHGGYGFSEEYAISRFHRDVRALRILGGADEALRQQIAAPELARRGVALKPELY